MEHHRTVNTLPHALAGCGCLEPCLRATQSPLHLRRLWAVVHAPATLRHDVCYYTAVPHAMYANSVGRRTLNHVSKEDCDQ